MGIWKSLGNAFLYNLGNNVADKLYGWGLNVSSLPLYEKKETVSTPENINDITAKLMGVDDDNWTRREQRRFRKSLGMSKQDLRNWKALQMGYDSDLNYSRRDLRAMERAYELQNQPQATPVDTEEQSTFMSPEELSLMYMQERFGTKPLSYMLYGWLPPTNSGSVTYNFGNGMNNYWANQALQVLGNLSQEQLNEISGGDGEINYDDAIKWQQSIGAGNDGKFGSNTINAMNTKYGLNAMTNYVNPINKQSSNNNIANKVGRTNWNTMTPYKFTGAPNTNAGLLITWG